MIRNLTMWLIIAKEKCHVKVQLVETGFKTLSLQALNRRDFGTANRREF